MEVRMVKKVEERHVRLDHNRLAKECALLDPAARL
jgi:hypothetical protein